MARFHKDLWNRAIGLSEHFVVILRNGFEYLLSYLSAREDKARAAELEAAAR